MALDPVHVGRYRPADRLRLKNGHATRPVRWFTAGAATATGYQHVPPGGSAPIAAQPGSTAYAASGLIGGTRYHLMQAVNTGSSAVTLRRWLADVASALAAGTHGTVSITATTLTRTTGSWLDEGWAVDDFLIAEGLTTPGNNVGAVVTGVTATTLTFAASTFPTAENAPAAGAKLYRGFQQPVSVVDANAGNIAGTAAKNLLTDGNPGVDTTVLNSALHLGPGTSLFVAAVAQIPAGTFLDLTALGGDL